MFTSELFKTFKTVIGGIIFWVLAFYVFLSLSYLTRENGFNSYDDRITVAGFPEVPEDTIDMVYIGGSAAFVYWEPYKAYGEMGFTSYDLATNTIQAESILPYIRLSQKTQNPTLYVIGLRAFQYYDDEGNEVGLRVSVDSLNQGLLRWSLISRFLKNRTMDVEALPLYLEIAKYHSNYNAFGNPTAWELIDNKIDVYSSGCRPQDKWAYVERPVDFQTTERATLHPGAEAVLNELLDYCDKKKLNVLFVVCPYKITEEHYAIYNTIGDIVTARGYGYLNANDYYDEMGLDFSEDLYNNDHVNALGAEKYTTFLEKYLTDNYDLPDHRGDPEYSFWDSAYTLFCEQSDFMKGCIRESMEAQEE